MKASATAMLAITLLISPIATHAHAAATSADVVQLVKKKQRSAQARKLAKVRADLHRNLDGKANGFIRSWSFDSRTFTLVVDPRLYRQHAIVAAAITARSIFDMDGVPLPKTLVIRATTGEVLGEGPFANVPKLVE